MTTRPRGARAPAGPPAKRSPRHPIGLSAAWPRHSRPRVSRLGASSLDGAEVGVKVTGDKRGSARSFPTEAEAQEYADEVAKEGDKTTIVGTVVLQAPTQDNADFFADAYEGG